MTRHYWMGGNRSYEQDRFFEASLDKAQWQRAKSAEDWQACWYTGMPGPEYFEKVGPERKINHIPGNNVLTVKSRLYRSVMDLKDRVQRQEKGVGPRTRRLDFMPHVYSMPEDYHYFQQAAWENPEKRWLLKPKNASKGKGIRLVDDPANVPMDASWLIQEYLEHPHTMHGRKYVLRLYVLVSSVTPFRVYVYHQGFAKLASLPYNDENASNPYSYLTNPDINALNLEAEVPVEFVDFDRYRAWLREQGHDDQALFARIDDAVALTCLAAQEPMRERCRAIGADPRGCYELMGIDCLIDEDLKPWVLECNLSPSLEVCAGPESGGRIEETIKGGLVADLVELVGLNRPIKGEPDQSPEQQVIQQTREELSRSGGFRNLIPGVAPSRYLPYMALPRLEDWVLAQSLSGKPLPQPAMERWVAEEMVTDEQVLLYDTRLGHFSALNETASVIWLMATEGAGPDAIASTLLESALHTQAGPPDAWPIRQQVWDTLADWAGNRFLVQASDSQFGDGQGEQAAREERPQLPVTWLSTVLQSGRAMVRLQVDSMPLREYIHPMIERFHVTEHPAPDSLPELCIVRDAPGYTMILDGEVVVSRRPLSAMSEALFTCLMREAPGPGDIAMDASVLLMPGVAGQTVMVAAGGQGLQESLSSALQATIGRGLLLGAYDRVEPLATPATGGSCFVSAILIPAPLPQNPTTRIVARRLTVGEVLQHMLPICCGVGGRPLSAGEFTALSSWVEARECWLVDCREPGAAAEVLENIVKTGGGHHDFARLEG
ncbi:tubulin--tyrosine ligase family protein [Marinobacter persicus]|uniref:Tubulin polyglutamylase TTLL5 n=1 Tax=Marinobacter persicus TaxID=930118 RepID=A0A2S6GA19_9GAMM|nr:tubulin--tyrosine ligase family protein [Marinobacter persicus]PPK53328.1 tubulin polyglutamylase TTLL5 [Marinobacter persicus]PPK56165.1 tubulin polyglutamylase TTLL5 [Marinobacter persicus]PPK59760.1 tubulin polyglutamylase TTLL5 [Marinobacter persicus]